MCQQENELQIKTKQEVMEVQDLRREFDKAIGNGNHTHEGYCERYAYFLEDKYVQTENSHQIALNIALERSDKIDQFRAKVKEQADQIESLKRQIKA